MSQVPITDDGLGQLLGSTETFTSHGGYASYKTPFTNPGFQQLVGALVIPAGPNYVLPSYTRPAFKHTLRATTKNLEFETTIKNETGAILNIQPGTNWVFNTFALPIDTACTLKVICLNSVCYGYILLSNSAPGGDPLASVPVRNWGAGTGRIIGVADNVVIGDTAATPGVASVSIGSSSIAQSTGVALGYDSSAFNGSLVAGYQATDRNNSLVVALGYQVGNISIGAESVNIGYQANSRTGPGQCVVIGSNAFSTGQSTVVGYQAGDINHTGLFASIFGYQAKPNNVASSNLCVFGSLSGAGTNGATFGDNAVSGDGGLAFGSGATSGNQAMAFGQNSYAANNAMTVGFNSQATQASSACFGDNLVNNTANTQLFGYNQSTVANFTGFVHSRKSLGASVGFTAADPGITFSTAIPVYTTLPIQSTRYNNGLVIAPADSLQLGFFGAFPLDSESTFLISANVSGTCSNAGSAWFLQLMWVCPGIFPAPGQFMSEAPIDTTNVTLTNSTLTIPITIPPATTGQNYVYCRMTRIQGVGTCTLTNYRLNVTRIA